MQPAGGRPGVLRFGEFEIDLAAGELRKAGRNIPLQDKPLQFLALLVEKEGRPVSREEIRDRLWGSGAFLDSDDNLNHVVRKVREALGDSADNPRFIKTLPRRGYRCLLPPQAEAAAEPRTRGVEVIPPKTDNCAAGQSSPKHDSRRTIYARLAVVVLTIIASAALLRTQLPSYRRPGEIRSLVILPFRSAGGGRNEEYLGEGISEQIAARLSALPGLRLFASAAAQRLASSHISPLDIGRRLGADTVLTGSVRRLDRKVRVNAQLIRTADGRILWAAGGLEVEGRDLLETEKLLSASIATRLRGSLPREQRSAISRVPTLSAEAYELFVRGKVALRGRAAARAQVAEQLFQQAIQLDPNFAEAYAWLAMAQYAKFEVGSAGVDVRDTSLANARRALVINPEVTAARRALITIFHSTGQAEEGLRQASILRRSGAADVDSLAAIAEAYLRAGMPDRAIPFYQQALSLDPEDDHIRGNLAFSAFFAGQHELGLRAAEGHASQNNFVRAFNAQALGRRELALSAALDEVQRPTTPPFRVLICGAVLEELGEGELAFRIFRRRLVEFERDSAGVRNERTQIGMALIYAMLGDQVRAVQKVRLAQEANPGDPWTLFFSAETYALLGDERASLAALREAVDRGFLAIHYLDTHFKHWRGLHRFAADPEFRALREQLVSKVARLRVQY